MTKPATSVDRLASLRGRLERRAGGPLRIAIVNNMPDAALRSTERQFCALLASASAGMVVKLSFYAAPGIVRSDTARAHIAACYEDFATLEHEKPHGLIVTGAEPKSASLEDEPFWPSLARLVDWTEAEEIPALWSCLAAHAAVLRADGIARLPLPRKLSGVFACTTEADKHQLLHRVPRIVSMPHSRRHGLDRKSLQAQGYTILSRSAAAGVDMFCKQGPALQLYWQGHPEYDAGTLLAEYRRDVIRSVISGQTPPPAPPSGLMTNQAASALRGVVDGLCRSGGLDDLPALDKALAGHRPQGGWISPTRHIVSNWLAYLDVQRGSAATHSQPMLAPHVSETGRARVRSAG
jgi:homoserine O-succinyltransferase